MPFFEDEILLRLKGESILIAENHEIRSSILTQPAGFSLKLGHGGVIAELLGRYPPQTSFELLVNGRTMQTGYTDGLKTGGGGGSEVTYSGRDIMGRLVSAYAPADRSFSNITYHELTSQVLDAVGLGDQLLIGTDAANRKAISGTTIVELQPAEVDVTKRANALATTEAISGEREGTRRTVQRSVVLKVGSRWYEWLKKQLDRAGLFLWATGDGAFMLAVPSADQKPAYRIQRIKRGERAVGAVEDADFEENDESRFTKMLVYGRGGGRKFGRQKLRGECIDPEMVERFREAGAEDPENAKLITVHDSDVKNQDQATHYARRRMAELNREGWRLSYTLSGYSTEGVDGNRAVWTPNTVVEVDDRELGIAGNFWIEDVSLRQNPMRQATVRLMRPQDLFFGLETATA